MPHLVLLGPQGPDGDLPDVLASLPDLDPAAPLAVITAGLEEREPEDRELAARLGRPAINLALFARGEAVFAADPEFFDGLRRRHDRMRQLQRLYRRRLAHAIEAVHEVRLAATDGGDSWMALAPLDPDSPTLADDIHEEALAAVRSLDAAHLRRIQEIQADWEQRWQPAEREALAAARAGVAEELARCGALVIAGGHVTVLLNRLRLFDLAGRLGDLPVVAWSAGAMVLTERVVLFHDSPPQGGGHAEVLDAGLGLAPHVVALPHATERLLLDDPQRVALLAGRLRPATCLALDPGARADWNGQRWTAAPGTRQLTREGAVADWRGP